MNKKTGIWLDSEKAYVIELSRGQENIQQIDSNVDHVNIRGGSGSSTPYGAQDAVSESTLLERRKHQFQNFYQRIIDQLAAPFELVIFGPAEAKNGLQKVILGHPTFKTQLLEVKTADSMTENQIKALVRDYFDPKK